MERTVLDIDHVPGAGALREAWDALAGRGARQTHDRSVTAWGGDDEGLSVELTDGDSYENYDGGAERRRWRAVHVDASGYPVGRPGYGPTPQDAIGQARAR